MSDHKALAEALVVQFVNEDGLLMSVAPAAIESALRAADQAGYLRGVAECEAIAEDYRARALADAVSGEGRPILTMLAGAAHVIRNHIRALRVKP